MIYKYKKGNKAFNFYESNFNKNKNIFTVIVGKNGTGKSRLLNDLISRFVPTREMNSISFLNYSSTDINKKIDLEITKFPDKVIAVSTSPYDKFPLPRINSIRPIADSHQNYYSYVGIRDLRTMNFSLGFMSKIIGQLLLIRKSDSAQFSKIIEVLKYLGYSDEFHITFEIRIINSLINELIQNEILTDENSNLSPKNFLHRPYPNFFRTEDDCFDFPKLERLKNILNQVNDNRRSIFNLIINSETISSEFDIEDISFLISAGVARLRDVSLRKLSTDKLYKISEASSGEQCIFTTLVGISCTISDNSLVLIDEPEISLHPEWQERYITLLIKTFQNFKNCHFIIATHSPQLISKLSVENCYILQMDNKELKNAKYYANNSIDFQLANIFNHPGFKNEYLLRIAMNIFSNISNNKKFGKNDIENYHILHQQSKFLKDDDPVLDLYKTIIELRKIYE